jgi:hypothetical protein
MYTRAMALGWSRALVMFALCVLLGALMEWKNNYLKILF